MVQLRYEWNEAKRAENLEKHGIDFMAVHAFDWTNAAVFQDRRRRYGERRFYAYGHVAGRLHVVVFTDRADVRRVISFRKANPREQAAYATGAPGN